MQVASDIIIAEEFKWLLWKITQDGTYLTVVPEFAPKDFKIKEIKNTLIKNKIVNFDIEKIEETIRAATGNSELIGKPLELFEEGKRRYLRLHVTPMQVSFSIDTSILETDYRLTTTDISFLLAEKSVAYGIDHKTIEEILSSQIYGKEFIIATATLPIMGKDAVVTEMVQIDQDAKPFLNEDGTVNYKKWENIRQIKEGDVICVRTPPTPGIPGISVFGQPLSPTPGEDYALPAGMNTKVIDDETKLVAGINGFLYRDGRNICVGGVYIVKGDVDFKTGNIDYYGDVVIRGNVNTGFSVIASGNISIDGFVESAHVEAKNGNVFLKGPVFGKNDATIISSKNIHAENIQGAIIKAGKMLTVAGHIRNCRIETENMEMPSKGQIISSSILFGGHLKCGCIGGKVEAVNEFVFVESERNRLKEDLQKLNEFLPNLNKTIDILQEKLYNIASAQMTPELENQKKLLNSQLFSCNNTKEQLTIKRKKILKLIEVMPDKEALISAHLLMPVLKFTIFGYTREYKQELSQLKIGWKSGGVKLEPL